jgi:hypothetical protein
MNFPRSCRYEFSGYQFSGTNFPGTNFPRVVKVSASRNWLVVGFKSSADLFNCFLCLVTSLLFPYHERKLIQYKNVLGNYFYVTEVTICSLLIWLRMFSYSRTAGILFELVIGPFQCPSLGKRHYHPHRIWCGMFCWSWWIWCHSFQHFYNCKTYLVQ